MADGRRRGVDGDEELSGEGAHTSHKIEFPKFDGADNPMSWLNRCEWYFRLRGTLEHRHFEVASFYLLDDSQVCYHHVELNNGQSSWNRFIQLVNTRFRPPPTEGPIGELTLLRRDDTIGEYCNKFMALS
jgi:hypothetical protein